MRPEILLGTEIHKGRDPVILIIDPDLGRVCWLGQLLSQAGCQVYPSVEQPRGGSLGCGTESSDRLGDRRSGHTRYQ